MLKAVIIDDEKLGRDSLNYLVESCCSDSVVVVALAEGVTDGLMAIHKHNPDIVFLDIQMKGETGFDLLNTPFDPTVGGIRQKDNYFNFDIGASYLLRSLYAHVTYRNIATSRRELYSDVESDNIRKFIINAGYVWGDREVIQIEPSIMYINTLESKERSYDLNLKAYRQLNFGTIWGGLSYRRQVERSETLLPDQKGQITQYLTPIIGLNIKQFMFAYNYTQSRGV